MKGMSRFAHGMVDRGLDVAWLKSLEAKPAKANRRSHAQKLHERDVITKAGWQPGRNDAALWGPGKNCAEFLGALR
jgi:hypothetical protein